MNSRFFIVVFSAVVSGCGNRDVRYTQPSQATTLPATQPVSPIQHIAATTYPASTPQEAVASFAQAIDDGDLTALRFLCTGTDAQFASIIRAVDLTKTRRRFITALSQKFPADAKLWSQKDPSPPEGIRKSLQTAQFQIDGDDAVIVDKDSRGTTLKLHKENGRWKWDLVDLQTDPEIERLMVAEARAYDIVAAKLEAGKYTDIQEVYTELHDSTQSQMHILTPKH